MSIAYLHFKLQYICFVAWSDFIISDLGGRTPIVHVADYYATRLAGIIAAESSPHYPVL